MGTRVVIEIAEETHEALTRLSERTRRPLEVIAADAVRGHVARQQDLLDAVHNGGETAQAAIGAEATERRRTVDAWLTRIARRTEGRFMEEGRDQPAMPPPPPDLLP